MAVDSRAGPTFRQPFTIIASNIWFDRFIVAVIVINCGFLAATDPLDTDPDSSRNQFLDTADLIFQVIYTIEMLVKILAWGLACGPKAYLRQSWNVIDGLLVISGWIGYLPIISSEASLSSIRVVRVLRPLRTMHTIPGLKLLVNSFLASLPQLGNVLFLCGFLFILFGVIGVQLFGGVLNQRCALSDGVIPENELTYMCGLGGSGRECGMYQGNTTECRHTLVNPNLGVTSFDTIFVAFLTIFQSITMEGWVDIMYWVSETGRGEVAVVYFVALIILGAIFLLNLVVAVIVTTLSVEQEEQEQKAQIRASVVVHIAPDDSGTPQDQQQQQRDDDDDDDWNEEEAKVVPQMFSPSSLVKPFLEESAATISPQQAGGEGTSEDDSAASLPRALALNKNSADPVSDALLAALTEAEDSPDASALAKKRMVLPPLDTRPVLPMDNNLVFAAKSKLVSPSTAQAPAQGEQEAAAAAAVAHVSSDTQSGWTTARQITRRVVDSRAFNLMILVFILLNTMVLGLEHHLMPEWLKTVNSHANLALTLAFAAEMVLKHVAYGIKGYWRDGFNQFDGIIVMVSIVEVVVIAVFGSEQGGGISALRALRLLRVLKLARSWTSLNEIIGAMGSSLTKIGPFSILLLLFMFIYSLLGMQLFGGKLGSPAPRFNYDSLLWSFVTTFQVLTGENWNEVMYVCISHTGWWATVYFVSEVVLGTYVVLNLFLAILIEHFTELSEKRDIRRMQKMAMKEAARRAEVDAKSAAALSSLVESAAELVESDGDSDSEVEFGDHVVPLAPARLGSHQALTVAMAGESMHEQRHRVALQSRRMQAERAKVKERERLERKRTAMSMRSMRPRRRCCGGLFLLDAFPTHESYDHTSFCCSKRSAVRTFVAEVVLHQVFEALIILLIIISCTSLALDSVEASQDVLDVLYIVNLVTSVLFALEMVLKLIAFGLYKHPGAYLRDQWNILDAFIVVISVIDIGLSGSLKFVKALRFLRALRPLRAVRRLRGLKVVINAVIRAFPSALNVALVCLLFFFLYGILGVHFFSGGFYRCSDPDRVCDPAQAGPSCTAQLACNGTWVPPDATAAVPRLWTNPAYPNSPVRGTYSFDNSVVALVTLFEVASLELWQEVMYTATDMRGPGWAPSRGSNDSAAFFFVIFIMLGSQFILNLFVSVVVDNFRKMKQREAGGSVFMTKAQEQWVELSSIIQRMSPAPLAAPPDSEGIRKACFKLVSHPQFDYGIMVLILLNVVVMMTQHTNQAQGWTDLGEVAGTVFGLLFLVEMVVKHVGLGFRQYWAAPWNVFDGLLVITNISITSLRGLGVFDEQFDVSLFRVIRVFRIFRLVKTVPQLRVIFTTLMLSLPSMLNVAALLVLLFFMYAVMGMNLYGDLEFGHYVNEHANFRNFGVTLQLLFRMSTGESWNGIMHETFSDGNLASRAVAYMYFISFIILGQFMMINLFVAVILENFERELQSQTTSQVKGADLERFADMWASMPRRGAHRHRPAYLSRTQFAPFLFRLGLPLGFDPAFDSTIYRMRFIGSLEIHVTHECVEYSSVLRELVKRTIRIHHGELDVEKPVAPKPPGGLAQLSQMLDSVHHTYSLAEFFAAVAIQRWIRKRTNRSKFDIAAVIVAAKKMKAMLSPDNGAAVARDSLTPVVEVEGEGDADADVARVGETQLESPGTPVEPFYAAQSSHDSLPEVKPGCPATEQD